MDATSVTPVSTTEPSEILKFPVPNLWPGHRHVKTQSFPIKTLQNIEIMVEDNNLIISGERRMEKDIKAACKDSVLKVVLPKKEEAKPRQIKIEVGQA